MRVAALSRRLDALEETTRPRIISTLAELVKYAAQDSDEEVELSSEMQAFVDLVMESQ